MKKSTFTRRQRLFGWLPLIIGFVIGTGLSLALATFRGFNWKVLAGMNFRWLSDGFFVVSVFYLGFGIVILLSSETDIFDIFSYAFRNLLMLFSLFKRPEDTQSFYDYKMERQAKRVHKDQFILIDGVILLIIAIVFYLLYRNSPAYI
ncbi:MAG: DUF3899 domain-containing protein [Clostridia bacterium]|nr:DUF3899 domain-containing protein [Clostridia bacterium]